MERVCRGCRNPLSPEETAVIKDGLPYCCFGCAKGTGCTCARESRSQAYPGRSLRRASVPPLEALLNEPWS